MDDALLQLQAAARAGDRAAIHRVLHVLLRAGPASPEVELAAYLLEPDAGALGPASQLPRAATHPGVAFELVSSQRSTRHGLELSWRDPARGSAWAELDARYAGIPREELQTLLMATVQVGVQHLVLDLRQIHGLTSGGMADLSKLKQRLDRTGGSLGMLMPERVRVATELLGLGEFLGLHDDLEAAKAQLDAAAPLVPALRGSSRWLSGILRWGPRRAEQAALCLAAHAAGTPELQAVFERTCEDPWDPDTPLPLPPELPERAREFWSCAERLHDRACWPDDPPQLTADELDALVVGWAPKLLAGQAGSGFEAPAG